MSVSIGEYLNNEEELERRAIENLISNARMAIPGIVVDFNPANQTATIQPAIMEQVNGSCIALPQLLDVPVQFPRAGGYCMTFPVRAGDECLVIFADMCIDAWWQSGGVQAQMEKRRHDLSDGIAILGVTSVPRAVKDYSPDAVQFRNEENSAHVEISKESITIRAKTLKLDIAENFEVTAPNSTMTTALEIEGGMDVSGAVNAKSVSASGDADIKGNIILDGYIEVTQHIKADEAYIHEIKFTEHTHGGLLLDTEEE